MLTKHQKQIAWKAYMDPFIIDTELSVYAAVEAVMDAEMGDKGEPICPHCGPGCLGGAAHNARAEDGVMYPQTHAAAPQPQAQGADVAMSIEQQMWYAYDGARGGCLDGMKAAHAVATRGMYTREQVKDALRGYGKAITNAVMFNLAQLQPKEPTKQEKVEAILLHKITADPNKAKALAAEIIAALEEK